MFDQQGVWVLPSSSAFGYPNAMLAKQATCRENYFNGRTSCKVIISIVKKKHYKQDLKFAFHTYVKPMVKLSSGETLPARSQCPSVLSRAYAGPSGSV